MHRLPIQRLSVTLLLLGLASAVRADELFDEQPLFVSRTQGFHTVRIPALIVSKKGTVLAFCEGRRNSGADHGDIDLIMRRSSDGGTTWSPLKVIAQDGDRTIGNPCPVVDRLTGTIWLPYSRDNKQVFLIHSKDDGESWSKPVEITQSVLPSEWHWVGPGPGHGIQLQDGRLVIPTWAGVEKDIPFGKTQLSYAFFSDDHGKTWRHGKSAGLDLSDECEVVERLDGSLYMNARSRHGMKQRAWSISKDGGETWTRAKNNSRMPEQSCQGSVMRVTGTSAGSRSRIIVAHPSSTTDRSKMIVRLSYDEAKTWPASRIVHAGSSAYSDLAVNRRHEILLAYEADGYSKISLARFNTEWLTRGRDREASSE